MALNTLKRAVFQIKYPIQETKTKILLSSKCFKDFQSFLHKKTQAQKIQLTE